MKTRRKNKYRKPVSFIIARSDWQVLKQDARNQEISLSELLRRELGIRTLEEMQTFEKTQTS